MKIFLLGLAYSLLFGCTIVRPPMGPGGSGGEGGGGGGSPGPTTHIQMLWLFHLNDARLVPSYVKIHDGIVAALGGMGVSVDEEGVAAQYGPSQLLWGQSDRVHPKQDLDAVLRQAIASGRFRQAVSPEQQNLATLGQGFPTLTVAPEIVDGASIPVFSAPRDGLVVVTVHSAQRACGLDDLACRIGASAPIDYFTAMTPGGTAQWITPVQGSAGEAANHVAFLVLATSEGESTQSFWQRCGATPGFDGTLLDAMAPSDAIYYQALGTQMTQRGRMASEIDLCQALGHDGPERVLAALHDITNKLTSK